MVTVHFCAVGGEKALPHIEIGRVEAGGRDPDQHVAGAEDRVWSVLEPELIDIAVGLETDSFHGRLRSSGLQLIRRVLRLQSLNGHMAYIERPCDGAM